MRAATFIVLLLVFAVGCDDDAAGPTADAMPPAEMVEVSEDPDVAEVHRLSMEFRSAARNAGLTGDAVRRLARTNDLRVLAHELGWSVEQSAAYDAQLISALDRLRARHPQLESKAEVCAPCVDEGVEAFAAWLDSDPGSTNARLVYMCDLWGLIEDLLSCSWSTGTSGVASMLCVMSAVCGNCTGC